MLTLVQIEPTIQLLGSRFSILVTSWATLDTATSHAPDAAGGRSVDVNCTSLARCDGCPLIWQRTKTNDRDRPAKMDILFTLIAEPKILHSFKALPMALCLESSSESDRQTSRCPGKALRPTTPHSFHMAHAPDVSLGQNPHRDSRPVPILSVHVSSTNGDHQRIHSVRTRLNEQAPSPPQPPQDPGIQPVNPQSPRLSQLFLMRKHHSEPQTIRAGPTDVHRAIHAVQLKPNPAVVESTIKSERP